MKIKKPLSFNHKRKTYYISFLLICGMLLNTYAVLNNSNLLGLFDKETTSTLLNNLEKSIHTKALPTVDFTFNNDGACSGELIQFTNTSTDITGDAIYSWDFGDGKTSDEENPIYSFEALGCGTRDFEVKLTVTDDTGSESTTKTISVLEKPDVEFEDQDGLNFNNCGNTSPSSNYTITLGNIPNPAAAACVNNITVDWGDGTPLENPTLSSFPLTHTYTAVGGYQMKIATEGTNGCTNEKIYQVSNASNPGGGFESPGSTSNLCAPTDELEFGITNWGENSDDTEYIVDFGDGTIITYTHAELKASPSYNTTNPENSTTFPVPHAYTTGSCNLPDGKFTAVLTVKNACDSTDFSISNISVLETSEPKFVAPDLGCIDSPISFINTTIVKDGIGCTTNASFTWDFGDGTITKRGSKTNEQHTYTTPGTYTVSLTVTNKCSTDILFSKEICIEPEMTPLFSVDNEEGCIPLDVSATNNTDVTELCSDATYLWTVTYNADNCGTTANWVFTNGTDKTSENPEFIFNNPGKYTLTQEITTECGKETATKIIDVKKPPTVSINDITDICFNTTISPTATVENCTDDASEISYKWTFTGGTPTSSTDVFPGDITYTTPGIYTVTLEVTSACGDPVTDSKQFEVFDKPVITNPIEDLTQEICSTESTSEITLTTDDTRTTFSWTATASNTDITGFTLSGTSNTIPAQTLINSGNNAGTVTYTVTPTLGTCAGDSVDFIITVNPSPVITTQPTSSEVCLNGTATLLEVAYEKGTGTASYQWYSNTSDAYGGTPITGANNASFIPLTDTVDKTFYYVEINFSSGGCSLIRSNIASVNVVSQLTINAVPAAQIICEGGTVNPLEVTYTGGTGNASYQWFSNTINANTGGTVIAGATDAAYTPTGLSSVGNYYYYAEISLDGNGCTSAISDVYQIDVLTAPVIDTQPIVSQEVCLNRAPTDLTVSASGGSTTAKNYQWYLNTTNSNTGGTAITDADSNTYTPDTSSEGTFYYYVVVSQPESGCNVTSDVSELIVKPAPEITVQPNPYEICFGESATNLEVDFINGTGTIQWYANTTNTTLGGTSITGATAKSYTPIVTSSGAMYYYAEITFPLTSACSDPLISNIASVTVNETPVIADASISTSSKVSFNFNPNTILGNTVPTGTKYTWSTPTFSPSPSGTILGASAATTAQDNISQTLENTGTTPIVVTYIITPITGTCSGSDFTLEVTVNSNITANAVITQITCFGDNNGAITTSITGGAPFDPPADPYSISWSGPNGFSSTDANISDLEPGDYTLTITDNSIFPFSKTYTITQPSLLAITTVLDSNISCFDGNDGAIDVTFSGGTAPFTYNWSTIDGSGIVPNTEDQNTLTAGTYKLEIVDANNCSTEADFTLTQPTALQVQTISKQDVLCFGTSTGAIDINVTGGTPSNAGLYTYNWTSTDGTGFISNSEDQTDISAGTYKVVITDSLGCETNTVVTINQSSEIEINYTKTDVTCNGVDNGTIDVNVIGGQPPYTISWSNSANGYNLTNLSADTYIVTITDANNCEKQESITITEPNFSINPIVTPMTCNGDNNASIELNLTGGIAPITVTWSDDASAGVQRNNLSAGTYTVDIVDSDPNQCPITQTFTIINPVEIAISSVITDATDCSIIDSGSIDLTVAGGVTPYTFLWSNGATSEDITNLSAGDYSVNITDANGCSKTEYFNIFRQTPLNITFNETVIPDCDLKTVIQTTTATVTGGFLPYTYSWSDGIVSSLDNSIMTTDQNGSYTLTITDNKGCTESKSFLIDLPTIGDADFNYSSFTLDEYNLLSIKDPIQFTNLSTAGYTNISWDFGDGSPIVRNEENPIHTYDEVGRFTVILRADYEPGCTIIEERIVDITKGYALVNPTAFTPNGDGYNETIRPSYRGFTEIEMVIYNTWGIAVYSEKNINLVGWDGTIKGKMAENGNYVMFIKGLTFYNKEITTSTPITLIR